MFLLKLDGRIVPLHPLCQSDKEKELYFIFVNIYLMSEKHTEQIIFPFSWGIFHISNSIIFSKNYIFIIVYKL